MLHVVTLYSKNRRSIKATGERKNENWLCKSCDKNSKNTKIKKKRKRIEIIIDNTLLSTENMTIELDKRRNELHVLNVKAWEGDFT